jgi:FkbM family methyltransferase
VKIIIINFLRVFLGGRAYLKFIAFKNKVEAIIGMMNKCDSYSQHGEDKLIYQLLKKLNLQNALFIDVGANHPIKISNTYLLYRNGMRGIVIEPNRDLLHLFEIVRGEDIRLNIGVGSSSCVQEFLMTDAHARNSFGKNTEYMKQHSIHVCKKIKIPVLSLDNVMKNFSQKVSFLSIDTEGMELEVLNGSIKTLDKTYLICIEANSQHERQEIFDALNGKFELIEDNGCNLIMYNRELCSNIDVKSVVENLK